MNHYETSLLVKTAWYYYMENMTQQHISEKLGISRMRVVKLLDKARKNGVVQFKIAPSHSETLFIEQKLTRKWQLKDAFVIPTPPAGASLNESIARAAAMYICDRLSENMYINMGYGDTPSRVLNHLATMTEFPISVVSLTGGVSYYLPNVQSNIFKARLHLYPAPLLVSSRDMCAAMRQEPTIQAISRMVRLANISVVGIGGMKGTPTILSNGILNRDDLSCLSMQGAVGDILTHFIDKEGKLIHSDIEERLLSVSLEQLNELDNVIAVAGGTSKLEAIRAALKGGYLDVLITDEETAAGLVEDD